MSNQWTRREILRQGTAVGFEATYAGAVWAAPEPSRSAPSSPVAIQRCRSYEPRLLTARLTTALDLIGGINDLVRGKTVTVKLNLTGGPQLKLGGLPAHRTYHVHPEFVACTCAALAAAGAKRIVLVESGYSRQPLEAVMAAAS